MATCVICEQTAEQLPSGRYYCAECDLVFYFDNGKWVEYPIHNEA